MNKIYKVIWSKVKGCYVVTSEAAKRIGKGKSEKAGLSVSALIVAACLINGAFVSTGGTGAGRFY